MMVGGTRVPTRRSVGMRKKKRVRLLSQRSLSAGAILATAFILMEGLAVPAGSPTQANIVAPAKTVLGSPFRLNERLEGLEKELVVACDKPDLTTGIFVVEPKTGRYVDVNGQEALPAASMIKVPVMVALLVALDKNQVKLDQQLVVRQDLIGGGSGYLQWRTPGSKISLKEVMELMIIVSDNTATNMIIDLLGDKDILNRQFAGWGLSQTRIANLLPDFEGTNTTSPYDLAYLLGRIDRGELISELSRKRMYAIMERTRIRTLLPQGLPPGTKIAHKTGDIAGMVGDVGIVTAAGGMRYIVAVQVARPNNDRRANQLIREVSRIVYSGLANKK